MEKSEAAKILNVGLEATTEEIRKAFKYRSKTHHPDKGGTEESFIKLLLAHDVLLGKDKPKAEHSQAMAEFMAAFQAALGRARDPLKTDLIDRTKGILLESKIQLQNQVATIEHDINVGRGILARLECYREDNVLANMITGHITAAEHAMTTNRTKIENIENALKIAREYKFNADPVENNFSGGVWSSTTVTF